MFLNLNPTIKSKFIVALNRKHEMFLNKIGGLIMQLLVFLTVNMKCF